MRSYLKDPMKSNGSLANSNTIQMLRFVFNLQQNDVTYVLWRIKYCNLLHETLVCDAISNVCKTICGLLLFFFYLLSAQQTLNYSPFLYLIYKIHWIPRERHFLDCSFKFAHLVHSTHTHTHIFVVKCLEYSHCCVKAHSSNGFNFFA